MGSWQVAEGNAAGLQLGSFPFKKCLGRSGVFAAAEARGCTVSIWSKAPSSLSPYLPFPDGCKMEKLLPTVEQESWAWWMSSKCGWIPWGVVGGGGWPGWWHLMECRVFYLGHVNLGAAPVERKSVTRTLKAIFRGAMHTAPLPSCLGSPAHIPTCSGPDQWWFAQAEEGRTSRWGYCLYHDVHRPGKSYPAHYGGNAIHHWFVSK